LCSASDAFFDIWTPIPSPPPPAACNSIAGTWTDQNGAPGTWSLAQAGNSLSGSLTAVGCTTTATYSVTGSSTVVGGATLFAMTASGPNPSTDYCGGVAEPWDTSLQITRLAIANLACDSASGTETDYYNGIFQESYQLALASSAVIPAGESSTPTGFDQHGFSAQEVFSAQLNVPSSGYQFAGRVVQETAAALTDGCNSITGSGLVKPIVPQNVNSTWNVQAGSTYGNDVIGYGSAVTRYYQTRAGTCSLTLTQGMQINLDSGGWMTYSNNAVSVGLTPTTVTVQRGSNASGGPASATTNYPPG
jgi:hypothetical protein